MFEYPVRLHHLFVSPGHNYFGQDRAVGKPLTHPTHDLTQAEVHAGKGLVGDRFYAIRDDFDGQVTFVANEVITMLRAQLGESAILAVNLRRNVVIEGADLNGLIGHDFEIGYAGEDQRIHFRGMKHCSPCRWMDLAVMPGAHGLLKGRGGLRAQALTDGVLKIGLATLYSSIELNLDAIIERLPKPRLPG